MPNECDCNATPKLIFACSGAADVGAIDGCPLDCARKTLEEAGFTQFEHVRLSDLGMEKGKTPATPEHLDNAAARGRMRLTA